MALVAAVTDVGFTKNQAITDISHRTAFAQQLELPAAVDRVAIQAGSDQLVVLDDQLFVDAATRCKRVTQHDGFGVGIALEVAGRKEINTRDLELG